MLVGEVTYRTALFDAKAGHGHGIDAKRALAATSELLRHHVSHGELESLANVLPPTLADLAQ
jgi:uncharacterized protein (DUF2267 family)